MSNEQIDRNLPDYKGPYDAEAFGADVYGHAVNCMGRCEGLNAEPPTCPPSEEE